MHDVFIPGDATLSPFILLHGHGGRPQDLIPIAQRFNPTAPVLAVAAPLVEDGRTTYFRHLPDGSPHPASLQEAATTLMAHIKATLSAQGLAHAPTLLGFSNGADLAAYAMVTQPVPFRRAILFHPTISGAIAGAEIEPLAVWASYGRQDPHLSETGFQALMTALRLSGATVTTYTHDFGHGINVAELQAAQSWLRQQKG